MSKHDKNVKHTYENCFKDLESKLLKLDISKAINELDWMPVLNFENTVKHTIEGYINDLLGKPSLKNRIETINEYTQMARKKKLMWALK